MYLCLVGRKVDVPPKHPHHRHRRHGDDHGDHYAHDHDDDDRGDQHHDVIFIVSLKRSKNYYYFTLRNCNCNL